MKKIETMNILKDPIQSNLNHSQVVKWLLFWKMATANLAMKQ